MRTVRGAMGGAQARRHGNLRVISPPRLLSGKLLDGTTVRRGDGDVVDVLEIEPALRRRGCCGRGSGMDGERDLVMGERVGDSQEGRGGNFAGQKRQFPKPAPARAGL